MNAKKNPKQIMPLFFSSVWGCMGVDQHCFRYIPPDPGGDPGRSCTHFYRDAQLWFWRCAGTGTIIEDILLIFIVSIYIYMYLFTTCYSKTLFSFESGIIYCSQMFWPSVLFTIRQYGLWETLQETAQNAETLLSTAIFFLRLCSESPCNVAALFSSVVVLTLVLTDGFFHRLLAKQNRLTMMRNAVWALSNLCRGKNPPPDFSKVNRQEMDV